MEVIEIDFFFHIGRFLSSNLLINYSDGSKYLLIDTVYQALFRVHMYSVLLLSILLS